MEPVPPGSQSLLRLATAVGSAHYVVDAIKQYHDAQFPTELIYGATRRPTLRLITSGGYKPLFGQDHDNVVVFAHLPT